MTDYAPPVQDMSFVLHDCLNFSHDGLDRETVEAVLDEAARLAADVLAPLNFSGDRAGLTLSTEADVKMPAGFRDAYQQYCAGGWNAVPFDPDFGGQGLPWALAFAVQEMWQGANMAFGLCPLLNQGAVEAILSHGSEAQKAYYLPKLISGEWTGTMNLTEPQAGSDLGLIRTRAQQQEDGTYKIFGQKIWITYGEHDLSGNIIHLVLARIDGAPDDVKGISLFIVPKILEDGRRNDAKCVGLDHKLGIHASPTCVMQYGDQGGATGYLIGEPHQGLKYMFTMMNNARLSVGLQGVAISERAAQAAIAYAAERVQGKSFQSGERVSINQHADVKRMILTMRALTQAGRALCYEAASALDLALAGDQTAQLKVDLLTPIVKSWCTDIAQEVTYLAIQVHGGMGFIEETKVAQYYRDARILSIYEGTNGIQAADLAFRKILRDGGGYVTALLQELEGEAKGFDAPWSAALTAALSTLGQATQALLAAGGANAKGGASDTSKANLDLVGAMATPYLKAFGIALGAMSMARMEQAAANAQDKDFAAEKKAIAQFYRGNILPLAAAQCDIAVNGSKSVA
ncbi:MAG: acyl-CoA dehydrogenase [Alphaproteobacteria bacterium]